MDAVDISNFTSRFTAAHVRQWKDDGVGLAIVQLIAGVKFSGDSCATQIMTCLDGGIAVDCYLFPGNDGLPLSTAQRLALVPVSARVRIRQLWIDIEPASSNASQAAIDKAHATCDAWAPWQKTGDYSALWVASKMGWLPWPWPTRKQWLVNVLNSGASNFGGSFAGTSNHVLTQYRMDVVLAGVSGMDRSVLAASEAEAVTRWNGGPMSINVGQGMQDQMAANGDAPLCDHVFFEQEDSDGKVYQVEKCLGTKGMYVSSNSSGTWINAGPV